MPPPFLTFNNCDVPQLAEEFLDNLCQCLIRVIPRARNEFVEIVAVAEHYFIINHLKNKESKKQPFRICLLVKLANGRMLIKMKKNCLYLIYNIVWARWLEKQSLLAIEKICGYE